VVPNLEILEKACRGVFSHLHIKEISGFIVGEGDEVIVSKKGEETNDQDNENEGKSNPIEADPARFKSSDLAMAGERAESEEGAQQSRVGDRPLKCRFWDFIEKVFEHQVKGSLISIEKIHLLEEEDNDIDQHQTAQAQGEDLQVFPYEISMKDTVAFKHFQKTPSISTG
jgi:hypothetical protein